MATSRDPRQLEAKLRHSFAHPELLLRALTHSSFAKELGDADGGAHPYNERLEFLGDSVLSIVTSEHLFRSYPDYREGDLSKLRAHLVSARHLAKVARSLGIGEYLRLGKGEENSGGRTKQALLADGMEALIAALYLDAGLDAARNFILPVIVQPEIDHMGSAPASIDHKSALQEILQAQGDGQPTYEVIEQSGPEHDRLFTIELRLDNGFSVRTQGRSKKAAEQRAAERALGHLRTLSMVKQI